MHQQHGLRGSHRQPAGNHLRERHLHGGLTGPTPVWAALGHRFTLAAPARSGRALHVLRGLAADGDDPGVTEPLAGDGAAELAALVSRLNLAAIDSAAGDLLLHAGAVARQDGGVAVVCGPSGAGKTTLTVRLVEQGLHYVTDEVVRLDPSSLRIASYRKPVSVKDGQATLAHLRPEGDWSGGPWLLPPSTFESAAAPDRPLTPRLLVFPAYRAGAGLEVEPVSEAESAFLLGGESSRLAEVRTGPLEALARLARRAPAVRVRHGDAAVAARAVADLLAAA